MRPKTHSMMARLIYGMISENSRNVLNYKSFKYGCIKPDFIPKPFKIPHYKGKSFDYLIKKIDQIEKQLILDHDKDLKLFSVRLGIIVHYIADYFCQAHNDPKYNFFPLHLVYENNLSRQFAEIDFSYAKKAYRQSLLTLRKDDLITLPEIKRYIDNSHKQYLEHSEEIATDIRFSLEACLTISLIIINNRTINNRKNNKIACA